MDIEHEWTEEDEKAEFAKRAENTLAVRLVMVMYSMGQLSHPTYAALMHPTKEEVEAAESVINEMTS
jgi:hypothetical protein